MKVGFFKPWLYAAPMLIAVAAVYFYPMAQLVRYSLQNVSTVAVPPATLRRLGQLPLRLDRQYVPHRDRQQRQALFGGADLVVLAVLISAMLIDRIRGWRFYRTMIFLPYVLSIPVVGVVFGYVFQENGIVNSALREAGLGMLAQDWLGTPTGRSGRSWR